MALTQEQLEHIKEMINPKRRMLYDDRENFNRPIMDFLKGFFKEKKPEEANQIAEQLFEILQAQKSNTNDTHFILLNYAERLAGPKLKLNIIEYRHPETKGKTFDDALHDLYKFIPNEDRALNILRKVAVNKDDKNANLAKTLVNLLTYKTMNDGELDKAIDVLLNTKLSIDTQRKVISLLNNQNLCDFQTRMSKDHIRYLITDHIIKTGKANTVVNKDCLLRDWLKTPTNFFAGYKFYAQRAISGNTSSYRKLLAAAGPDKKPQYKLIN